MAPSPARPPPASDDDRRALPLATSHHAEIARPLAAPELGPARRADRGVVVFDVDGTILDSVGRISQLAGDVLHEAFGTPPEEGRIHYLATTGMPFEAQLAQLYPDVPAATRAEVARGFHQRKVQEAYAEASPFPEMPRLLKRLGQAGWTLAVSTGAEREMAELVLEREGLRFWFDEVLGSGQGTKREHLRAYAALYPGAPMFLVGDSRFDMEAAGSVTGVLAIGRASALPGWTLTPDDLRRWGAVWADYSLAMLPDVLDRLVTGKRAPAPGGSPGGTRPTRARSGKGRDRESPKTGDGPASV
jgi:phosphoglycolate phosphatase-like HAD superfamily hydrolase